MNGVAVVVAVAGIAFDERGAVLLVKRGKSPGLGLWTVPGGRVELGELLVEACAREVEEETGLRVEVGPLVEVVERIERDADGTVLFHFVIHDYLVTPIGGTLAAGSDAAEAHFLTAQQQAALPLTVGLAEVIERARGIHAMPRQR